MIETVKIVKDHAPGYAIINKADFDPERHELFKDAGEPDGDLIAKALALKVLGPNGKPVSKSVLERWASDRLEAAITAAEKAIVENQRKDQEAVALELGLDAKVVAKMTDAELAAAIVAAKA